MKIVKHVPMKKHRWNAKVNLSIGIMEVNIYDNDENIVCTFPVQHPSELYVSVETRKKCLLADNERRLELLGDDCKSNELFNELLAEKASIIALTTPITR